MTDEMKHLAQKMIPILDSMGIRETEIKIPPTVYGTPEWWLSLRRVRDEWIINYREGNKAPECLEWKYGGHYVPQTVYDFVIKKEEYANEGSGTCVSAHMGEQDS